MAGLGIGVGLGIKRQGPVGSAAPPPSWSEASIVGFGDSITAGQAATLPEKQWLNLLATSLSAGTPLNQGIAGTVLQNSNDSSGSARGNNGRNRFEVALTGANKRALVVIAYGYNDARYTGAPVTFNVVEYKADLNQVVAGLVLAGYSPSQILIVSPYYITDTGLTTGSAGFTGQTRAKFYEFVTAASECAAENGTRYCDIYAYMLANGAGALISGDSIHPTDSGHAVIAAGIYSQTQLLNYAQTPEGVSSATPYAEALSAACTAVASATAYEFQAGVEGTFSFPRSSSGASETATFSALPAGVYRVRSRVTVAGQVSPWAYAAATTTVAAAAPAGPFLVDSFTEATADTTLVAHTPVVGGAWVKHSGSTVYKTTAAGRIYSSGTTSVYYNNVSPPSADYYVECGFVHLTTLAGSDSIGVTGRMSASLNTMYHARWVKATSSWELLKLVAGAATSLGSVAGSLVTNTESVVRLSMMGSSISLSVNGVAIISVTDTDITAAGYAGLRGAGVAQTATTGVHLDNMKAEAL